MRRRTLAAVCGAVGLVGLAGCGGSGSSGTGSSSAADTAAVKRLCPEVRSAEQHYTSVAEAMGLQFTKKSVEVPTRKAAEALLLKVQELERVGDERQKRQLGELAGGLSNQTKMFKAFERHDQQEAAKYGNSIQGSISRGLANVRVICR